MKRPGRVLVGLVPSLIIGIGFVVAGFFTDPSALTDDGHPLKTFMFFMGGSFILIPLLILVGQSLAGVTRQRKIEDLLATGQEGEAVVLGLEDTGVRINDNPRVRISLEVRVAGYPPYQVEKSMVVPLIRLPQVQVGSTVRVLADASQPENGDRVELLLR